MNIIFLCDSMHSIYGPVRPALLLAVEFLSRGHTVTIVTPYVLPKLRRNLNNLGIEVLSPNIDYRLRPIKPLMYFAFESIMNAISRKISKVIRGVDSITLNFSNQIMIPSHVFYAQGPVTLMLRDVLSELPWRIRILGTAVNSLLMRFELRSLRKLFGGSCYRIANSRFCAKMYEELGLRIDEVIYPPINCSSFTPRRRPRGDYVITYFGKETKFSVVKRVADEGVKIKAFGSKSPYIPRYVLNHRNVEFLGRVSHRELVELYSNALYTLFAFTHEPFGYVPVESMACGTPVLTYDRQGPSETVINGVTGWLAKDDDEIVKLAIRIWRDGYPSSMRVRCRERALEFDVKVIADKWFKLIEKLK